jgi:hypothetical protein
VRSEKENFELMKAHNHAPCYVKAKSAVVVSAMKERALQTFEKPKDTINQFISGHKQNLAFEYPKIRSLVSRISKVRKQKEIVIPENIEVMPQILRNTLNNEKFLYYENINVAGEKNLVYTTYNNLIHLENTDCWVGDGTFYACPVDYTQLYMIQGCVRGKFYPLLFALMETKEDKLYDVVFNFLFLRLKKKLNIFICDFEKSQFLSFKKIFTTTRISLCFFSFLSDHVETCSKTWKS